MVTGGGRGIGRAIAEALAGEGANLALCARSADELEATERLLRSRHGVGTLSRTVDVSDEAAVRRFADEVLAQFSRVDLLVNNAGTYGPVGPLTEVDIAGWVGSVSVNLFGVVHAIRAFAPAMIRRGEGRIINVAGGGVGGPNPPINVSSYTSSKAAVACLTETISRELAAYGIAVNALAPGAVGTRLIDSVIEAGPELAGTELYERTVEQRACGEPIERVGEAAVLLALAPTPRLTGKLLSVKWDDLERVVQEGESLNRTSMYALRRIDGVLFAEQPH